MCYPTELNLKRLNKALLSSNEDRNNSTSSIEDNSIGVALDFPIDLPLGDKLKLLRKAENISLRDLCDLTNVPRTTISNVESGRNKSLGSDSLKKIVSHPRFVKYAVWLLFDQITEEQAQEALDFLRKQEGYVEPPKAD